MTAFASLGGSADSAATLRKALSRATYTVYERHLDSSDIREFSDSSGKIFAVAWSGGAEPDFSSLLGNYLNDYRKIMETRWHPRGQRVFVVKTARLIVKKWGHLRQIGGYAYDPSLIPPGVTPSEIR